MVIVNMERFFYELDRLFYLCSIHDSNSDYLKGYVFLDNVPNLYTQWFGSSDTRPDYRIPFYIWKKYGCSAYKKFKVYNKKVKELSDYYSDLEGKVKIVEDNSELWRYYTIYKPLRVDREEKTISEKGSITYNNTLYIEET